MRNTAGGIECGYIDKTGEIVLEAIYDEVEPFIDGIAKVNFNRQYGYINKKGRTVLGRLRMFSRSQEYL